MRSCRIALRNSSDVPLYFLFRFSTSCNNEIKSPVITITVDNIDHSLILAKKNGGKLLTDKTPVSDMGFMAYVKDSEGNIIGLWQNLKKY